VARREHRGADAGPEATGALITLLARAVGLERAALLLEAGPHGDLEPVALHNVARLPAIPPDAEPGAGPWSLTLPIECAGRPIGLLLCDRGGGTALPARDRALAERMAEAIARLVEQGRLAADLERTRDLLAQADRLSSLGTLAAGVAHEIRNPLVSVRTFIQLLPERLTDEEFRTNFRELALSEIERICGLINDLLAFSRPAPSQREPTDLNEVVGQIARLLDAEARKRDVAVACTLAGGLPLVVVDEARVKQVLMNVTLNAIQASGPGGQVEITTAAREHDLEHWCAVCVADSGPGIAADLVEQIFDPFFTTKDQGSGLGLFIARQIMSAHGGTIAAWPRREGGTEFVLEFPVRTSAERRHAP